MPPPQDCLEGSGSDLEGVTSAVTAARAARESLHAAKLAGLRLQAEAHGATVQERLARGVTHILVHPPGRCEGMRLRCMKLESCCRVAVELL
jgi:hypothetical protein